MRERWRPIDNYPAYDVSDQGRVRSWHRGGRGSPKVKPLILKQTLRVGYPKVNLCSDGIVSSKTVHSLVLQAFRGACPKGYQAAHDDGVRTHSVLRNLAWKTVKDNHADKHRHGTMARGITHGTHTRPETVRRGSASGRASITDEIARVVKQRLQLKQSATRIAKDLNISRQVVYQIANGWTWRHV